jgi:hypothetical protein
MSACTSSHRAPAMLLTVLALVGCGSEASPEQPTDPTESVSATTALVAQPQSEVESCVVGTAWAPYFTEGSIEWTAREDLEEAVFTYLENERANGPSYAGDPLVIPVVVHVVLNEEDNHKTPEQQVPLETVQGQIEALNRDFGADLDRLHVHGLLCDCTAPDDCPRMALAAPPCIVFELARRNPDGDAHDGVTYTTTACTGWDMLNSGPDAPKLATNGGCDAWDTRHFFNIWVVDMLDPVQGVSSFPGGDAARDGIVLDVRVFGNHEAALAFRPGRHPLTNRTRGCSATHETGHWLNLYHPWGPTELGNCSLSDEVEDTPPQSTSHMICGGGDSCPDGTPDLCQNFMDYTDDSQRVLFTAGQTDRMRGTLYGRRSTLLGSSGHIAPVAGADAWIADAWDDVGEEPDATEEPVYGSPDIWMRRQDDGLTNQQHQSPLPGGGQQHAYVRVRNRGTAPVASATVTVYWARPATGLTWPWPWDGSDAALGGTVGTATITNLLPNDSQVVPLPWTLPAQPTAAAGPDPGFVSLLARLDLPGPAAAQPADLLDLVRGDNDIAWKNVWVTDLERAVEDSVTLSVVNGAQADQNLWVVTTPQTREQLNVGQQALQDDSAPIQVDVTQALKEAYEQATQGKELPQEFLQITQKPYALGPLHLGPRAGGLLRLRIPAPPPGEQRKRAHFVMNVQQFAGADKPDRLLGGVLIGQSVRASPPLPPHPPLPKKH